MPSTRAELQREQPFDGMVQWAIVLSNLTRYTFVRSQMQRLSLLALLILIGGPVSAQTMVEKAKKDEITSMQDEEPEMRKAFERARATLDNFLSLASKAPPNTSFYAVKVGIQEGKNTEYFWIGPFKDEGNGFSGTLDNTPRLVKKVKEGQTYQFAKRDIVDWTYVDTTQRRLHGNFTMCALLTKEPPAQAEDARRQFGLRCD